MDLYGYGTFAAGVAVLIIVYSDFFYTTLSGNGDGLLTRWLNRRMASLMMLIHRSSNSPIIYKIAGLIHLLLSLFFWIVLLLFGTFLIFNASPEAIIHGSSRLPADYTERFYYCCYMLSTLGIGDMVPGNSYGQYATSFLTFGGFTMLTIGLTYLLSILEGVQRKRQLASKIFSLGNTPLQMYKNHYATFPEWSKDELVEIRSMLNSHTHKFIIFPVVHYFRSSKRNYSLMLAIITIDSSMDIALQRLKESDSEGNRLLIHECIMLKNSISDYLEELKQAIPSIMKRKEYKKISKERIIAMQDEKHYFEKLRSQELSIYLREEGWEWDNVYSYDPEDDQKTKVINNH